MYRYGEDMSSESECHECGGEGYLVRPCPRCDGTGVDPFFTCMSVPCVDCGGARHLYFLCFHILSYAGYSAGVS
jgi:hypothetical protein